ncbi:CocE/NonD family hydrolase [Enhygromyxa salina]|uniref:X-Pro dipeptidyl-peptidase (S15 family) n=1 Tax=Enhygromyxa salina TaxID=215803 RepID=A0A2S9YX46_9BACT|nr:CocE/NonD family hydrolase [Enhygromyxa salina]PRQ09663.1 X-Pro dipeptidyl-peptidase (S15 family) [Enhygromyxa salina]
MANQLCARTLAIVWLFVPASACASSGSGDGPKQTTESTTSSGDGDGDPGTGDGEGDPDDTSIGCTQDVAEITLITDDGIELAADLYLPGEVTTTALLLHMIPPNDKRNYPPGFIALLAEDHGLNVINVNRRGAPGSGGESEDGYIGETARLDAKAAIDFMADHPCANGSVVIVGASNGTTGALDMALYATEQARYDPPTRMVFLSPGQYTENQTSLEANLDALVSIPTMFAYPSGEAAWNQAVQAYAPASWSFVEYAAGSHGTGLFTSNPESIAAVASYVAGR